MPRVRLANTFKNVVVLLVSLGQKPDGGPEPVSQRQLGFHLHLAVHESEASCRPVGTERGHGQSSYTVSYPALQVSTLSDTTLKDTRLCAI
jgi:hypothetical protein